jgi:hypothetical protein
VRAQRSSLSDDALAGKIKAAIAERDAGRRQWIDGSVKLAELLAQVRARVGEDDSAFGGWLTIHDIKISRNDRAALINLGRNPRAMREVLEQTTRHSYQHIWNEVQAQMGEAQPRAGGRASSPGERPTRH